MISLNGCSKVHKSIYHHLGLHARRWLDEFYLCNSESDEEEHGLCIPASAALLSLLWRTFAVLLR